MEAVGGEEETRGAEEVAEERGDEGTGGVEEVTGGSLERMLEILSRKA